jgi:hypothetical protein
MMNAAKHDFRDRSKANRCRIVRHVVISGKRVERISVDDSASMERTAREPKWHPSQIYLCKTADASLITPGENSQLGAEMRSRIGTKKLTKLSNIINSPLRKRLGFHGETEVSPTGSSGLEAWWCHQIAAPIGRILPLTRCLPRQPESWHLSPFVHCG